MNIYTFTGRLGRDQETRYTQSGMAICSFTVAVDYGFGDNKGTNWVRCSIFGKRAEGRLPSYLVKGTQVAVNGELRVREYDDKDGNRRTSVEVSVNQLDLIGGRNDQSGGGSYPQQSGGQQAPQQQYTQPQPTAAAAPQAAAPKPQPAPASDPFASTPDFAEIPPGDDVPF